MDRAPDAPTATDPAGAGETPPPPAPYPSAVLVRLYGDERRELNEKARSAGLTLQNYCRLRLDLPLPEKPKSPYTYDPARAEVSRAKRLQRRRRYS